MTSKALEAAAREFYGITFDDAKGAVRDVLLDNLRQALRAFAQNISEDAADVVGKDIHERDNCRFEGFPPYETARGYRVYGRNLISLAIEKDLE